nr:uncharacterized protein LOC109151360 isoform X1 [Ipomoea batatas]
MPRTISNWTSEIKNRVTRKELLSWWTKTCSQDPELGKWSPVVTVTFLLGSGHVGNSNLCCGCVNEVVLLESISNSYPNLHNLPCVVLNDCVQGYSCHIQFHFFRDKSLDILVEAQDAKKMFSTMIVVLCFSIVNANTFRFPVLLLGCISVDEKGNRVFVSDSNHHRIIVFDANGEILDCIGSSPGFEDGDFENAKLMRPAASFYHAADNCLYIADSENHAIRRADMERRILDTLYPATNSNMDSNSLWSWIFGKLWSRKDIEAKSDEFPPKTLLFPWHISKCQNDLFVLNRKGSPRNCGRYGSHCQGTSLLVACYYIINYFLYTEGFSNISEICGHLILEKSNILKQIPNDLLKQLMHTDCSLEGIPHADLISSIATFQDDLIICNTVGQEVLKFNSKSGTLSPFQFSNFSILGLPYWFSFPMERVYAIKDALSGLHVDHAELFNMLPGKVDIKLSIDIPESFELVEPLNESCIWRQARGAATVVSEAERISTSEKVCAAQQWYDELDHRTFWESEVESNKEVHSSTEPSVEVLSSSPSEVVPEGKVLVDCCINTSPGTSEVIISAALYLKLRKTADSGMDSREQKAAKIADSLDPTRRVSKDLLVSYLLASKRDLEGLVVTRPLQVRLKFECPNHLTSEDNSKEIIITDSSINVSVSLLNP